MPALRCQAITLSSSFSKRPEVHSKIGGMDLAERARVFVSYSWDDDAYRLWVLRLATRLRRDGVDARLDYWHLRDGQTIPEFMNSEVRNADKVLTLCTPTYRDKVHAVEDGREMAGSGWEAMLVTSELFGGESRAKMVPALARGVWSEAAPSWMQGLDYLDLSDPEMFEENYANLLRRITGTTAIAPPLGELPAHLEVAPVAPLFARAQGDDAPRADIRVLIGVAVDLSGSMKTSIRNNTDQAMTRLEGFRQSMDSFVERAKRAAGDLETRRQASKVEAFIYGFGLRHRSLEYADLLTLLRAAKSAVSREAIEDMKRRHARTVEAEYRHRASGYSGLGDLARSAGFGGFVEQAAGVARRAVEAEVRERVMNEIAQHIRAEMERIGDQTVTLNDLGSLWGESEGRFSDAEALIYGATPMKAALGAVRTRFERELSARSGDTQATLFILSDGAPTDGDPTGTLAQISDLGVKVICCFVTSTDIADPRRLYGEAEPGWAAEARLMFDCASQLEEDSDFARFLVHKGWAIDPGARMFVQLNHSDVLEEFMSVALAPLHQRSAEWQLPVGE